MIGSVHRKTRLWNGILLFAVALAATLAHGENQKQVVLDGITFDSAYDNGSMGQVVQRSSDRFLVPLYEEQGELGPRRYWFRFRIFGPANRTLTLDLEHAENPRPFIRESAAPWRRMTKEEAPDLETVTVHLLGEEHPIELAFFEPLGVNETIEAVDRLTSAFPQVVTEEPLGETDDGMPLTLFTITDKTTPIDSKQRVWVHSRAHAGEVTSTHVLLGMLERLMEDSPRGRALRSQLIVHVVPLLNPDGIRRGHTRWDAAGRDPESQRCAIASPAIQSIKAQVDVLMNQEIPITLALNLHSTKGAYADTFFFKHLTPSVSSAFEVIQQRYIDALADRSPLFENLNPGGSQLHACRFIESYFWNGWGEKVMALTHEGHFHRRLTDNEWITGDDYRSLGRSMASALTDFYELSPARTLSWEEWQAEHFDALERRFESLSGPLADPDDDNRANILEYGQATHPRRFDPSTAPLTMGNSLSFSRSLVAGDATWYVEYSSDLVSWRAISPVGWEMQPAEQPGIETVAVPFPKKFGTNFIRVAVDLNKDR